MCVPSKTHECLAWICTQGTFTLKCNRKISSSHLNNANNNANYCIHHQSSLSRSGRPCPELRSGPWSPDRVGAMDCGGLGTPVLACLARAETFHGPVTSGASDTMTCVIRFNAMPCVIPCLAHASYNAMPCVIRYHARHLS
jgi:hypothetical protein